MAIIHDVLCFGFFLFSLVVTISSTMSPIHFLPPRIRRKIIIPKANAFEDGRSGGRKRRESVNGNHRSSSNTRL
jgi:hypothetical protein